MKDFFAGNNASRKVAVIQGLSEVTSMENTTTLGREASDYTALLLAHSLKTKEVTIWKDVSGVMTADPKYFKNAKKTEVLSYQEAVELAYYGASVIHPKTINTPGKCQHHSSCKVFPEPGAGRDDIKHCQTGNVTSYLHLETGPGPDLHFTQDFSFIVEEKPEPDLRPSCQHHIKVNVMQNSAISFTICVDADHLTGTACWRASENYTIRYNENVNY